MSAAKSALLEHLEPAGPGSRSHPFLQHGKDGEVEMIVEITTEDYEDLGRPSEITVTIQPGDHLND